jgi:protoporphyrinogen oxidase
MAPSGKTSLVVELPCQSEDPIWTADKAPLVNRIALQLARLGWISPSDVSDAVVQRMSHAYPILDVGHESKVRTIAEYLAGFENLKLTGRNGKFAYTHFHDMMRFGISMVDEYLQASRELMCVAA